MFKEWILKRIFKEFRVTHALLSGLETWCSEHLFGAAAPVTGTSQLNTQHWAPSFHGSARDTLCFFAALILLFSLELARLIGEPHRLQLCLRKGVVGIFFFMQGVVPGSTVHKEEHRMRLPAQIAVPSH
ncbi:hypothetical protein AAY473_004435 [Plecturocebus cupreus]